VFAGGIAIEDCERIHQLTRTRWDALHRELAQEMTRAYDAADEAASARMRVGIYTYFEDGAAQISKAPDASVKIGRDQAQEAPLASKRPETQFSTNQENRIT
jgi:hypothetical protein